MKKWMHRLVTCASIISLVFLFTSCSSGGGDGGSPELTYSGETSAATISEDNAATLASGALDAGSSGPAFDFTGIAALSGADPGADASDRPLLLGIVRTLEDAVGSVDFTAASEPDISAATQSENGSMQGSCGGSASYSISLNADTGAFSGNFSFSGYCAEGLSVNGNASFSGIVNMSTEELVSFTFTFSALTMTSSSESVTMNGSIVVTIADSTITMNMTIQNNTTGWACKVVNYEMVITDNGTYTGYSVSGRFFDQDYGYVDLETTETLIVNSGDEYPSDGILTLTGAGGTSAVLTAIDADYCRVDVDGDGDGTYEVTTGPVLWSEL